ncbi:hypothetical protein Tco_1391447 [Tanacetum coccineum]
MKNKIQEVSDQCVWFYRKKDRRQKYRSEKFRARASNDSSNSISSDRPLSPDSHETIVARWRSKVALYVSSSETSSPTHDLPPVLFFTLLKHPKRCRVPTDLRVNLSYVLLHELYLNAWDLLLSLQERLQQLIKIRTKTIVGFEGDDDAEEKAVSTERGTIEIVFDIVAEPEVFDDIPVPMDDEGSMEYFQIRLDVVIQELYDHMLELPFERIVGIEEEQRAYEGRAVTKEARRARLLDRIGVLEKDNMRLRGPMMESGDGHEDDHGDNHGNGGGNGNIFLKRRSELREVQWRSPDNIQVIATELDIWLEIVRPQLLQTAQRASVVRIGKQLLVYKVWKQGHYMSDCPS